MRSASELTGLRGAIVWAVTPYVPQAPFLLWAGAGAAVREIPTARALALAVRARELDPEQTYLVPGKLRPVVLLQDRPRRALPEFAALRLVRLEALRAAEQEAIRGGREPSLLYLAPNVAKYGLTRENAVDINALLRVHESAIVGRPVGRLDSEELRTIGERLVEHLDIDLVPLLDRRLRELRRRSKRARL